MEYANRETLHHVCVFTSIICVVWVAILLIIAFATPVYYVEECAKISGVKSCGKLTLGWTSIEEEITAKGGGTHASKTKTKSYGDISWGGGSNLDNVEGLTISVLILLILGFLTWLVVCLLTVWFLLKHALGKNFKWNIPYFRVILLVVLAIALLLLAASWLVYLSFSTVAWDNDTDDKLSKNVDGPWTSFTGTDEDKNKALDSKVTVYWTGYPAWAFMLIASLFACVAAAILLVALFPAVYGGRHRYGGYDRLG